jgi:type IV pilus assembly protein PilB
VLSSLHTNDAVSALTRLTEMGIEPYLVGSAVRGVLAQRLARRLCQRCKAPDPEATEEAPAALVAVGCPACARTGYRGRLAVHEMLVVSPEIERLASERAGSGELTKVALAEGMVPLRADGQTALTELLRVVA